MSIEQKNKICAITAFLGAGFAIGAITGMMGGYVSIGDGVRQFLIATFMLIGGVCGGGHRG